MADDVEKGPHRRTADQARGAWREALRRDFRPWFDALDFGFQCRDGWQDIVRDLTLEIARIVGGPDNTPALRVTQAKEKYGTLHFYVLGLTAAQSEAVDAAIQAAEFRSAQVCEVCGAPGVLRESRGGWWHTACDKHALTRKSGRRAAGSRALHRAVTGAAAPVIGLRRLRVRTRGRDDCLRHRWQRRDSIPSRPRQRRQNLFQKKDSRKGPFGDGRTLLEK